MARTRLVPFARLLIAIGLAALAASALPATSTAAKTPPCWKQLINDWYDGRIDRIYPVHCYRDAIEHLPEDVEEYSSAEEDIRRALLAAIRGGGAGGPSPGREPGEPVAGPGGFGPGGGSGGEGGGDDGDDGGVFSEVLDYIGPKNADSIPLPLLVLAGIAFLLLAAAGTSFVARRVQARRVPVGPPPDGPGPL